MEADVLGYLKRLQDVADAIDRHETSRKAAREEKERIEENLQRAEAALEEREKEAHAVDIDRRKRELALKNEKDRMARIKSRLGDVKTGREYQAVLAETSTAKQAITDHEDALLKDMESLEGANAEIAGMKATIEAIRTDLARATATLDQVVTETEGVIGENRAAESELLQSLPVEVVDRYRLIRSRRGGLAVVEARDEACTACFMRIPPQMYIEVIRRSKVLQCPNCHRILIPPAAEGPE